MAKLPVEVVGKAMEHETTVDDFKCTDFFTDANGTSHGCNGGVELENDGFHVWLGLEGSCFSDSIEVVNAAETVTDTSKDTDHMTAADVMEILELLTQVPKGEKRTEVIARIREVLAS